MKAEETLDELSRFGLKISQPRDGYRFSLDPLLLCAFAERAGTASLIDLGTGCGIIPLVMSSRYGVESAVGLELQPMMADYAARNVALNSLSDRIFIVEDDIVNSRNRFSVSSFDLVISNPPYRNPGSGRVSPRPGRDLARHESSAGIADFISAAKFLVKPGGRICFIYHPARLAEFVSLVAGQKLSLIRLRMVHGTLRGEARMFLAELAKGRKADVTVEPPLVIYREDSSYSDEVGKILGEAGTKSQ